MKHIFNFKSSTNLDPEDLQLIPATHALGDLALPCPAVWRESSKYSATSPAPSTAAASNFPQPPIRQYEETSISPLSLGRLSSHLHHTPPKARSCSDSKHQSYSRESSQRQTPHKDDASAMAIPCIYVHNPVLSTPILARHTTPSLSGSATVAPN